MISAAADGFPMSEAFGDEVDAFLIVGTVHDGHVIGIDTEINA